MIIKVLIGQRKCRYAGEYAPEVLAAIDEYGDDDNPDYMEREFNSNQGSGEFTCLKIFNIKVDSSKIDEELSKTFEVDMEGQIE